MSRRISQNTRNLLELVERLGGATVREIGPHVPMVRQDIRKYCKRCVSTGMMTATAETYPRYSVTPRWREIAAPAPPPPPPKLDGSGIIRAAINARGDLERAWM